MVVLIKAYSGLFVTIDFTIMIIMITITIDLTVMIMINLTITITVDFVIMITRLSILSYLLFK